MMNQGMRPNLRNNRNMFPKNIDVKLQEISEAKSYNNEMLLTYKIFYPQFESKAFQRTLQIMNNHYRLMARKYALYCEKKLFLTAKEQYEYSIRNRLPIQRFEAVEEVRVTYNQNCTLSLYKDRYEYMGGAHGNTERSSDTWNLRGGGRYDVMNFFPKMRGSREFILSNIILQTEDRIEKGEYFFDNYEENIRQHFDSRSFFLAPEGIVFYFQQYDIAPYASGIITFTIPFEQGVAAQPSCNAQW
jgi:Protein of unknown function (DUF3298).